MNRSFFAAGAAGVVFLSGVSVWADVSVAWTAPPDGTTYPVGTLVNPVGAATASGSLGGSGLDLALVLDSSGSMTSTQGGKTRQVWQQEAAIGLVNGLPQGSSSVAVVEFDSDANLVRVLTPLVPDKGLVISAINSVDANGGTAIGTGIDLARQELTGVNATAGRTKVMVVISDGESSGNPGENADTARTAGVNQIHSVGIPGHDITTMQEIVDGLDDNFGVTPDNHGTYTGFDSADDLNLLLALFAGTGGTLVGIKSVDVTMPDGTILLGVQDGLGNFTVPEVGSWAIQAGANVFVANATADDGATKSATLTLYGEQPSGVPDFGSTLSMLGLGLFGLAPMLRRGRK